MNKIKYEQLRQVIINANPDIVKLEFGCWCETKYLYERKSRIAKKYKIVSRIDIGELSNSSEFYIKTKEGLGRRSFVQIKDDKIIGRDIKLADVLIAIPDEKNIYISNRTGLFSVWSRALNEMVSQHINWNLQNNSLDWHWKNQKETVDFLFNLLV